MTRQLTRVAMVAGGAAIAMAGIWWHVRSAPESFPFSDSATTALYALLASTGELGTGAYSRFGWYHPGPLLYQVLALPYALSGYREVALKWTMLALNLSTLAAMLGLLRRQSPILAVTVCLALAPLIYLEQRLLFWAWNPVAPLLPLGLALVLGAGIASGSVAWLPWLVVVLSFEVQSHVGLLPACFVIAIGTGLLAWRSRESRTGKSASSVRLVLAWTLVAAIAVWIVPLSHEFMPGGGNLRHLLSFFWSQPHAAHSWTSALDVVAIEVSVPTNIGREFLTGDLPAHAPLAARIWAAVYAAFLIAAVIAASRGRRQFAFCFACLSLASTAVAVVALKHIVGPIFEHLATWVCVVGLMGTAVILSEFLIAIWPSTAGISAHHPVLRAGMAAYVAGAACLGIARLDYKQEAESHDHRPFYLTTALETYWDSHGLKRPLLSFSPETWGTATAVVLQTSKHGRSLSIDDTGLFFFGPSFRRNGGEDAEIYMMSSEEMSVPAWVSRYDWIATDGGYRLLRVFRR